MKNIVEKLRREWREEKDRPWMIAARCWIWCCLIFSGGVLLLRAAGVDA